MMNPDPRVCADRIRTVVNDEPKAFAYDLGLSLSAVYNYMNGRIPTTDVLFKIARYTGRPMEWFLDGEGDSAAMTGFVPVDEVVASTARAA